MVVADLHVHTTNSDGTLPLSAVPDVAADAGLSAVAVTDHDRLHPDLSAPVADVDGVTVVHGIELRVDAGHERVDLLGYGARGTDALESLTADLQADRVERGREILERVESRLGVDLPIEARDGIGRPHIASAIESATEYSYQDAFDELIGNDGPCYVARDVPSFETGLDVLQEACSIVALAHPFRYEDVESALELCGDLDALERFYPYGREVDTGRLERAVEAHDLLITGGSDAHGETLGDTGLEDEDYRRFRSAV